MQAHFATQAKAAFEKVKALLDSPDWTPFENKAQNVQSWKRSMPGSDSGVEVVKATGVIEGIEPKELRDRVYNQTFEDKKKVEDTLICEETLEGDDQFKVIYQAYQLPWPLSSRDVVILRSRWEEGDTVYQVDVSTQHEKKPAKDPYVRAEMIGCYKHEKNEKGTTTTYMIMMDPRGSIPSFVVNMAQGKPALRIASFRNLAKK